MLMYDNKLLKQRFLFEHIDMHKLFTSTLYIYSCKLKSLTIVTTYYVSICVFLQSNGRNKSWLCKLCFW